MTTPSSTNGLGLGVMASDPLLSGRTAQYPLTGMYNSYSHTISAWLGFDTATITLSLDRGVIEEWFENGLGRDIIVTNEAQQVVWQGFVNQVSIRMAGLSVSRGPLLGITNQLEVIYSPLDATVDPPAIGVQERTAAQNAASIAQYGYFFTTLSAGTITDANAVVVRNTYLAENALPESSAALALGQGGDLSITLSCLGYAHWLNVYPYNNSTSGTTNVGARLQAVLTANPNNVISTNYANMSANTLSIPVFENDDKRASDYIKSLVALGDAANLRYVFGVYEGREAYYATIPTVAEYAYTLSSAAQNVIRITDGTWVYPWDVRPAKWIFVSDFMIGYIPTGTALRNDPRYVFIESATYTAPWGLSLQGAKVATLPQIMAQSGLAGAVA